VFVYTVSELEALAGILIGKGVLVISDDIYEKIIYDGKVFINIASLSEDLKNMTVLVNGVSKAYSMTGWRIGMQPARKKLSIQSRSSRAKTRQILHQSRQKAAVEALNGPQNSVTEMVEEFRKRKKCNRRKAECHSRHYLHASPGSLLCISRRVFVIRTHLPGKVISNSSDFAAYLLDVANVAVVPGGDFGHDDSYTSLVCHLFEKYLKREWNV